MKERMLDVIKWGLIFIIAGAIFYAVCPKYVFGFNSSGIAFSRCNKITGQVEMYNMKQKIYKPFGG